MLHNTGIAAETSMAALAVAGAQPVWLTLNDARERAFTGEIVFETDPEVFAYLDHGIVYYAERATDASLGSRLLEAGVIDKAQLDRGAVRVGDIEHLGRLFDRDPSVDRDAVVVVAEVATQELIADLANRAIVNARVTSYRHHPSGVHRWFVAPLEPVAVQRSISAIAPLDSMVVDQLPGLPFSDTDELTIEWDDEFDDEFDGVFDGDQAEYDGEFDLSLLEVAEEPGDEVEILHDDEIDVPIFELSLDPGDIIVDDEADVASVASPEECDFTVVWPEGPEEPADGAAEFAMPPLELSDEPDDDGGGVPDDVAEAVRRAIAAIELASVTPTPATEVTGQLPQLDDFTIEFSDPVRTASNVVAPVAGTAASVFAAFGPPAMATRAEVLYGQMTDDGEIIEEPVVSHAHDEIDRSSALRRLIGSLRRREH